MAVEDAYSRDRGLADKVLEEYGSLQGVLFLLPTLILLTLIVFIPLIQDGILLSLRHYTLDPETPNRWVWFENYAYWLVGGGSSLMLFSMKMTLMYELVVVPFDLVIALGAALVMNEAMPARPFLRGLMLAGYASPTAAAGLAWAVMEHPAEYGVIFQFLTFLGIPIPEAGGMQATTPWAFWAVVLPKVWRDFGFMYIVFLAGVQSIPASLYEMARVDGAGPVQRFRYITIPHLRTVVLTVVMIRTVFTISGVAMPWAITQGGPVNYTTFMGLLIFKKAFIEWILSKSAALGLLFAAVMVPMIVVWIRTETQDYD